MRVCVSKMHEYILAAGGVDPNPALTLLGSTHEMRFRKEAVPAALQSLELNSWQGLTMEGTPSKRLWAEAVGLALVAAIIITAETTESIFKGALILVHVSVVGAEQAKRSS